MQKFPEKKEVALLLQLQQQPLQMRFQQSHKDRSLRISKQYNEASLKLELKTERERERKKNNQLTGIYHCSVEEEELIHDKAYFLPPFFNSALPQKRETEKKRRKQLL